MFKITLDKSKKFKKDRADLDRDLILKKRIKLTLQKLAENPLSIFLDIKKLKPKEENKYRLRVGDYRVIYSIDFGNKIIIIHRIGLRGDIYA